MPGVVGRGPASSSSSAAAAANFAAAARVLFESAQKAGAVKPLDKHARQYTHELARMQQQTRPHRIGSSGNAFDGVSLKIAEFLAAQRAQPAKTPTPSSSTAGTAAAAAAAATRSEQERQTLRMRAPVPLPRATRSTARTTASSTLAPQPALDIPLFRTPPAAATAAATTTAATVTAAEAKAAATTTARDVGLHSVADAMAHAAAPERDTPATTTSTPAHAVDTKPAAATVTATTAASSSLPDIHLVDDEPLFDAHTPVEQAGAAAAAAAAAPPATTTATASVRSKPVIVVPRTLTTSSGTTSTTTTTMTNARPRVMPVSIAAAAATTPPRAHDAADTHDASPLTFDVPSVDAWEQQREREIARLQQMRDAEEQQRLAVLRDEEHRALGVQWVQQRSRVMNASVTPATEEARLLYGIQAASSVHDSLAAMHKLVALGPRATPLLGPAFASMAMQLRALAPAAQAAATTQLLTLLEHDRVPRDVAALLRLRVYATGDEHDDAFLATYHALPDAARQRLDVGVASKAAALLTRQGSWQEAVALAQQCQTHFPRASNAVMAYRLLASARGLDDAARGEVVRYAAQQLRDRDGASRSVSCTVQLALARAEPRARRRSMLQQLVMADDADERVYAELILCEDAASLPRLLQEMQSRGLDCDDPAVLRATALRLLYDHAQQQQHHNSNSSSSSSSNSDNPAAAVFDELQSQLAKIGLRPMHVDVALRAVQMHPGNVPCLRAALALVKQMPVAYAGAPLQQLLPLLYSANLTSELVDVYDHLCAALTSTTATTTTTPMPLSVTQLLSTSCAFVNDALRAVGREPASALTVSDIAYSVPSTTTATGSATDTTARAARVGAAAATAAASAVHVKCDLAALTERMLAFTKTRDWAAALQVVQQQMHGVRADDNAAAVTLIYNCALGAAVEQADVVQRVYALMRQRGVAANATTVNTVLSSLSKAGRWQDAVAFAETAPPASKDNNTYLMHLSLLGQHDVWEQVLAVFDDMRGKVRKPPPALFTVALAVACKHSWQATLRLYEDMVKVHGGTAGSIKDTVTSQVVRCLERHGRTAELARIAELGKKSSKKKKK